MNKMPTRLTILDGESREEARRWRSRPGYAPLLLLTIILGLTSRRYADSLPTLIAAYAGDALWAAMVFWITAILRPRATTLHLAGTALSVALAVEISQLYHASWIDAIRATRLGALVLGHGFLWSDLACYAIGVAAAAAVDVFLLSLAEAQRKREVILKK